MLGAVCVDGESRGSIPGELVPVECRGLQRHHANSKTIRCPARPIPQSPFPVTPEPLAGELAVQCGAPRKTRPRYQSDARMVVFTGGSAQRWALSLSSGRTGAVMQRYRLALCLLLGWQAELAAQTRPGTAPPTATRAPTRGATGANVMRTVALTHVAVIDVANGQVSTNNTVVVTGSRMAAVGVNARNCKTPPFG